MATVTVMTVVAVLPVVLVPGPVRSAAVRQDVTLEPRVDDLRPVGAVAAGMGDLERVVDAWPPENSPPRLSTSSTTPTTCGSVTNVSSTWLQACAYCGAASNSIS
jgi:hypothetical protein